MGKKTSTAGVGPVKVVWHGPDSADRQTSGKNMDFFVFANPEMVDKWRSDKSVPLIEVVDSFDIFEVGNGGNTGVFSHPSKQALENAFNTSNDAEVIQRILTEGKVQAGAGPHHQEKGQFDRLSSGSGTNYTRGGYQGRTGNQNTASVHN
ncbi:hypothetical protein HDV00_009984 [Rhizophlyctis rosea]|nr:hypothetical protein HDV00_009984 [Rhizophlyctis rosea]